MFDLKRLDERIGITEVDLEFETRTIEEIDTEPNKKIVEIVDQVGYSVPGTNRCSVAGICDCVVNDDLNNIHEHYKIVQIHGGNNGNGNWESYFEQLSKIITNLRTPKTAGAPEEFGKAWLIDLEVDCLDDVWTAYIGFDV